MSLLSLAQKSTEERFMMDEPSGVRNDQRTIKSCSHQASTAPKYVAARSSSLRKSDPTQPLQRPLPWLDRDLLDANEGNIRDGSD